LHENRELERLFEQLASLGVSIDDYSLVQEESVTGERLPTKYAWELTRDVPVVAAPAESTDDSADTGDASQKTPVSDSKVVEAANVPAILAGLSEIARRGMEVKRFKGLGEMDPPQLWETTMDVTKRTLLRVTWDGAADADTMFTILMGESVEDRRKFIEEHALEVKNLDV
jgi:DNA gyrase subunit B